MLKDRGAKISQKQVIQFLIFKEEICPWLPEEGSVSLQTWDKVGEGIKGHYKIHGFDKMFYVPWLCWMACPLKIIHLQIGKE